MMKYSVIGSSTSKSFSPLIHNWIYKVLGLNSIYTYHEIGFNQLPDIIIEMRNNKINGINVTNPFKEIIIPQIDTCDTFAKSIGSINCIKVDNGKIMGYNTDYYGFCSSIFLNKVNLNGNVLVLGAGGGSRAICMYLNEKKINFSIYNRSLENSKRMISSLNINGVSPVTSHTLDKKFSIIINCITSEVDPISILSSIKYDFDFLDTFVDLNYNTEINSGLPQSSKYIGGIDMLIYQALKSIEIWTGRDISSKIDFKMLKEFIKGIKC